MTLLLLLLSSCGRASAPAPELASTEVTAPRNIDVQTLAADLEAGTVSALVDVRTPEEFSEGHIPGAVNIPVDELTQRVGELENQGELYLVCRSGGRSARAAGELSDLGFRTVNVEGGTLAWIEAGHSVE